MISCDTRKREIYSARARCQDVHFLGFFATTFPSFSGLKFNNPITKCHDIFKSLFWYCHDGIFSRKFAENLAILESP